MAPEVAVESFCTVGAGCSLYGNPLYAAPDSCVVHDCPIAEESVRDSFWLAHRLLLADESTTMEIADILRKAAS